MPAPSTLSPGNLAPAHLAPSTQPFSPAETRLGSQRESSSRDHIPGLLSTPRSRLPISSQLPHPSVRHQPHSPVGIPARGKRLKVVGGKGRKSRSAPWDRGDDATKEKVQESSAICSSSQFPAPCLSFPVSKIEAMAEAACQAFLNTCCRKMSHNSKLLLKSAACPVLTWLSSPAPHRRMGPSRRAQTQRTHLGRCSGLRAAAGSVPQPHIASHLAFHLKTLA